MKIVDMRDELDYMKYNELSLYKIYEYHYASEPEGIYMKVADGLLAMRNGQFIHGSAAISWSGAFIEVECELHIVK